MNAVAIGPFVFAPDRFAAILAIFGFLMLSEILARKVDKRYSFWAWGATIAFIIGARIGHVGLHLASFAEEPWRVFAVWQGGFRLEAGAVAAVLFTLYFFRQKLRLALWTAIPAAVATYIAIFILQLTAGTPATPLPTGNTFVTLSGASFKPNDLEGGPVVVNLWASWCPPCRREMPMMADVAASSDEAKFVFVNQGEGRDTIEAYLVTEGLTLGNVVRDSLGEFARHYSVPGLPATLFIRADGTLQSVHVGEISREGLTAGVQEIQ
ncbi:prolipoprotein diacylglyceryl transferase family protein [Brucella pituitosa]|uniref:prolipoprotein diacylglyceryl transferase family protein n=1 Tax=Brucella pituitosa TaxID=571256 RepID=UPI003F4A9468